VGKDFIVVFGQHLKSNNSCVVVNVYAACNLSEKVVLLEELSSIKSAPQDFVWCFCGDFKTVRSVNKRKGAIDRGTQSSEIKRFNSFIERNFLLELPIVGKKFICYKSNVPAKNRLDRVLVSNDWLQKWSMSKQYVQSREVLDHAIV